MEKLCIDLTIISLVVRMTEKTDLKFTVGQDIRAAGKTLKITRIVFDEAHYHYFKQVRYILYVNDGGHEFVWRCFDDYPVSLIYDMNE